MSDNCGIGIDITPSTSFRPSSFYGFSLRCGYSGSHRQPIQPRANIACDLNFKLSRYSETFFWMYTSILRDVIWYELGHMAGDGVVMIMPVSARFSMHRPSEGAGSVVGFSSGCAPQMRPFPALRDSHERRRERTAGCQASNRKADLTLANSLKERRRHHSQMATELADGM